MDTNEQNLSPRNLCSRSLYTARVNGVLFIRGASALKSQIRCSTFITVLFFFAPGGCPLPREYAIVPEENVNAAFRSWVLAHNSRRANSKSANPSCRKPFRVPQTAASKPNTERQTHCWQEPICSKDYCFRLLQLPRRHNLQQKLTRFPITICKTET